ncbi:MAG: PorP/SprF family type IX secretion system membrane protein [Edaphocola sp.]
MRKNVLIALFAIGCTCNTVMAQDLHFSQYYNAPMLLSPANTGLMPENDFRAGVNYRNQWSNIPSPFHTMAAYGDAQLFKSISANNWLGLGGALFNDRSGNGDLSLLKAQVSAAYHLQMGDYNMLSIGLGAAFVQRSVNFGKLTFDTQWDGFTFNPQNANGETNLVQKTSYADIAAGINYALFPNENVYFKLGIGLLHVNQPKESFYNMDNRLGMRPTANLDMLFRGSDALIIDVSGYCTYQKGAYETVFGAMASYNVTPRSQQSPNILLLGMYHRLNDAMIPMVGLEWKHLRATVTTDVSMSGISPANGGNGAFEFSLTYMGLYNSLSGSRRTMYNCPRF